MNAKYKRRFGQAGSAWLHMRPPETDQTNPWSGELDTSSRLIRISESRDVLWLQKVRAWTDNTAAVRAAAERQLRKLQREREIIQ